MPEQIGVALRECLPQRHARPVRDLDHSVLSDHAQEGEPPPDADLILRDPLVTQARGGLGRQCGEAARNLGFDLLERTQDLLFGEALHDGVAQTEGAEQTGVGRNEDRLDRQTVRDATGMLRAGAAERDQGVGGGIIPAPQGDPADGVGHALVGDFQESLQQFVGAGTLTPCGLQGRLEVGESPAGPVGADRHFETLRIEPSEQQVDIRERQGTARPVARRSGVGAGAARADPQPVAVEPADRAASGGDALDRQRRGDEVNIADLVLEEVFVVRVETGDVGAGAAHVEGDEPLEAGSTGGPCRADDSSRRSAQQAVLGVERARRDQTAGAGHHVQPSAADARLNRLEIIPHDRGQIGVDDGGLGARQKLDGRRQIGGAGDVREAGAPENLPHLLLVTRVAIGVQQSHRGDADAAPDEIGGGLLDPPGYRAAAAPRRRPTAVRAPRRPRDTAVPAGESPARTGRGAAGCRSTAGRRTRW